MEWLDLLGSILFFVFGTALWLWIEEGAHSEPKQREQLKSETDVQKSRLGSEVEEAHEGDNVSFDLLHDQKKLIGQPFELKCEEEVFTEEELNILGQYGVWFAALCNGDISSMSDEQSKFVEDCRVYVGLDLNEMVTFLGNRGEQDQIKATWFKYLFRVKYERENY